MIDELRELKLQNILYLALLVPKSYEDNHLSNLLEISGEVVFEAKLISISKFPKFTKIVVFATTLGNLEIEIIYFHIKPFILTHFSNSPIIYLKGVIKDSYGKYQIVQPKILKDIDKFELKYSNKKAEELIKKYLTFNELKKFNLSDNIVFDILKIHFPDRAFVREFNKNGFSKNSLKSLKFVEIFNYFYKLKPRVKHIGIKIDNQIEPFLNNLPFKLTNDQQNTINDIMSDFTSGFASKRVVIGDVGCGKSMVMFALAYLAKKSILMAPTTILVKQLFEEANKYLSKFLKIGLVINESKDENLENYDLIIGTHALLYKNLPNVNLIMIDEQHRFGVAQRQKLEKLTTKSKKIHFIQLSATPIPRTKALIDLALVDYSFIKELPFKKDITTKIIKREDFKDLLTHIKTEIEKSNQIIIIYPLIEESNTLEYKSINEGLEYWIRHFENVYVTHGKDKNKDKVLEEFKEKGSILISTTVVEVGISLPKVSTIIIAGAERLGFATLHQLRGRVSRNGLIGYCFLYTNKDSQRLEEFIKTKDGFEIAELDLKFRDSGDVFGENQSGKVFNFIDLGSDEEIIKVAYKLVNSLRKIN